MHVRTLIAALLLVVLQSISAQAQSCNFSMTNVDFGSVNLLLGGTPATTGTFTATCSGTANSTITICPNINEGTGGSSSGDPRHLKAGARTANYNLFQDAAHSQIWGSYTWGFSPRPPVLSLTLNGAGTGSATATVYAALSASQPALTGTNYQSGFNGPQTSIDYGYAPGHSCSTLSARATRAPFTVNMTNDKACNILTSDLDFGTLTSLATPHTATTSIGVTCTSGLPYNIGLSNGSGGGTGPTARRMTNPSTTQFVTYGIYSDAGHTLPWGGTIGTNTVASSGTGLTQNFTAYGQIPTQTQPPSGQYIDTIIVTVSY